MATKHSAPLNSLSLETMHVPLAGRDRSVEEPADVPTAKMPSHSVKADRRPPTRAFTQELAAPSPRKKEYLIPYSVRLPLSTIERLDGLKSEYMIGELLRDFIAYGLQNMSRIVPK